MRDITAELENFTEEIIEAGMNDPDAYEELISRYTMEEIKTNNSVYQWAIRTAAEYGLK